MSYTTTTKTENLVTDDEEPYYGEAVCSKPKKEIVYDVEDLDQPFSTLKIDKMKVKFPFPKPYPAQNTMMWKLIRALETGTNALIESPTGSGKTISFLCSSIAWMKTFKKDKDKVEKMLAQNCQDLQELVKSGQLTMDEYIEQTEEYSKVMKSDLGIHRNCPRIWIGTRTHQQIGQIINELKNSPYGKEVLNSCLAARDRMCCNDRAKKHPNKNVNDACNELVKNHACKFHRNIQSKQIDNHGTLSRMMQEGLQPHKGVFDIEDLMKKGLQKEFCPYYASQRMVSKQNKSTGQWVRSSAEVIVCPYQYLIDPSVRSNFDIKNDIVIIDEAHNIEGQCREAASFRLNKATLDDMISSIDGVIEFYERLAAQYSMAEAYPEMISNCQQLSAFLQAIGNNMRDIWDNKMQHGLRQDSYKKTDWLKNWETQKAVRDLFKTLQLANKERVKALRDLIENIYWLKVAFSLKFFELYARIKSLNFYGLYFDKKRTSFSHG